MDEEVAVTKPADGVTLITINRESRRNAVGKETALQLAAAFAAFENDPAQRVAVLTGAGDLAFSSGADLKNPPELWRCTPTVGVQVSKPLIAAVAGHCIGGGLVLAMMCDLVIAADNARFAYPEARVGTSGGMAASLVGRIPQKIAMEILLTGRTVDAQRALSCGFVNEVVATGRQVPAAIELAREMAGHAPRVLKLLKQYALDTVPRSPAESAMRTMAEVGRVRESADAAEGVLAFKEKRPPRFTGL